MIKDFLIAHADENPVSFHMPGHKGSGIYRRYGFADFLDRIMECDITEIPGADNLFQTEGIIRQVQDRYRDLYQVQQSHLLINGTSGGLIAAILAVVPPGGKLILARNCHKSVFNGVALGGIQPVYAHPEILEGPGIAGELSPKTVEEQLKAHPDAAAVILPSPNYYGVCSDVAAIGELVHRAGKVLIVDQAHGAHLHFFHRTHAGTDLPQSAESQGADLVVNSIHKTLASFTQSALLNRVTDRVSPEVLEDKLQAIQSTSPSYLLMASLDINARLLEEHGDQLMADWKARLDRFYASACSIPGLGLMNMPGLDRTKINLDMGDLGISGAALERELNHRGIYPELYTGNLLMCMTGIGNTDEDFIKLTQALQDISRDARHKQECQKNPARSQEGQNGTPGPGPYVGIPQQKEWMPLIEAGGRIAAGSLIPYPPGIPLICPGEVIPQETARFLLDLRRQGEKVIGISQGGQVLVGKRQTE